MTGSKRTYIINIMGCDDTTTISHELSDDEFAFLNAIAEKVDEAATGICMPTIGIKEKLSEGRG